MVKKIFSGLVCFIALIIFVSTLHGQDSKKTIILPSGEVVCDLNGEWDALYELKLGNFPDMVKITQQGGSFVGIKMIGTHYVPKGEVAIKGELDKNGVKEAVVTLVTANVSHSSGSGGRLGRQMEATPTACNCKGQISEDGNKIILHGCETVRVTLTRK
jgi:hypothetical protein